MITTEYYPKPIPIRNFDWEAFDKDADETEYVGYGLTEQEAIQDYLNKLND